MTKNSDIAAANQNFTQISNTLQRVGHPADGLKPAEKKVIADCEAVLRLDPTYGTRDAVILRYMDTMLELSKLITTVQSGRQRIKHLIFAEMGIIEADITLKGKTSDERESERFMHSSKYVGQKHLYECQYSPLLDDLYRLFEIMKISLRKIDPDNRGGVS